MKCLFIIPVMAVTVAAQAQTNIASEQVLSEVNKLYSQLPANITEAHKAYNERKVQYDSIGNIFTAAYRALADKINKRSAKINSMAGYNVEDATLTIVPANSHMSDFFRSEWDKMDALERTYNQQVKSFYGKESYKTKGYLLVWDSVYQTRRTPLTRYRDGVLKLVQAEIAYLKANEKIFTRGSQEEKMQYVETELSILQKLVLLRDKYYKAVTRDGAEKVQFCIDRPEACK